MIDTHAHLYAAEFDADRPEMLQRAKDVGVRQIYLPNIDLASIDAMHRLEDSSNGFCISMMGLHPCSVREDFQDHLAQLKLWLDKRPYAAIGEIGIDLYWDKSTFDIKSKPLWNKSNGAMNIICPFVYIPEKVQGKSLMCSTRIGMS